MARGMHKYKEPLTEQLTEERATFQFLEAEYGNYILTKMAFLVMIYIAFFLKIPKVNFWAFYINFRKAPFR